MPLKIRIKNMIDAFLFALPPILTLFLFITVGILLGKKKVLPDNTGGGFK